MTAQFLVYIGSNICILTRVCHSASLLVQLLANLVLILLHGLCANVIYGLEITWMIFFGFCHPCNAKSKFLPLKLYLDFGDSL